MPVLSKVGLWPLGICVRYGFQPPTPGQAGGGTDRHREQRPALPLANLLGEIVARRFNAVPTPPLPGRTICMRMLTTSSKLTRTPVRPLYRAKCWLDVIILGRSKSLSHLSLVSRFIPPWYQHVKAREGWHRRSGHSKRIICFRASSFEWQRTPH